MYCIYTIYFGASKKNTPTADGMCTHTIFFMQSSAVPNSVSIEKGLARCLAKVEGQGSTVQSLTTGKIVMCKQDTLPLLERQQQIPFLYGYINVMPLPCL